MNNKLNIYAVVFLLVMAEACSATSTLTPEGADLYNLETLYKLYEIKHNGVIPDSWPALLELSNMSGVERMTKTFSFIPAAERPKFPEGDLLLISYAPKLRGKTPSVSSSPDLSKLSDEEIQVLLAKENVHLDLADPAARQKIEGYRQAQQKERAAEEASASELIRYLLFRRKNGETTVQDWTEDRVQKMLADTGIVIPPPTPYTFDSISAAIRNLSAGAAQPAGHDLANGAVAQGGNDAKPPVASVNRTGQPNASAGVFTTSWKFPFVIVAVIAVIVGGLGWLANRR